MESTGDLISLSQAQFDKLRGLIHTVSGIQYADHKKYLLESRLQRRLRERGLRSFDEYHDFLVRDPRAQEEFTFLFNEITTNETSFFRNLPQLEAFELEVLPELLETKRRGYLSRLRLWSAACSSGEEPYTLAMILKEATQRSRESWHFSINATDISTEMLNKGESGVYNEYTMRSTPLSYKEAYFERLPDGDYRVKPEIRRMVRFGFLNFTDDAGMRQMGGFDVIFARNVLIYFDLNVKQRFVQHFFNALNPGGYLFVGHSENLHRVCDQFEAKHFRGAMAYRKP